MLSSDTKDTRFNIYRIVGNYRSHNGVKLNPEPPPSYVGGYPVASGFFPHYSARVIALIDYGSGNLRSVHKALLKVGADVRIAQRPGGDGRRARSGAAGRRRV